MELNRISGQKSRTLLEFYSPQEWPSQWGKMPKMMCQLITALESIEHEPVWVFTSHDQLMFTNKDDYANWQVMVKVTMVDEKQHYKITVAQKSPWAHLIGFTDKHDLAAELILKGLLFSGSGKERNIFLD